MKLIIVDLDGTLVDTKDVNYHAYKEALEPYGYKIDYKYYCDHCNGYHYLDFLPQITAADISVLNRIHEIKKKSYKKHLDKAILNKRLVDVLKAMRIDYKTAIVTNASKENCYDILEYFGLTDIFDLIVTRDDISNSKPNPEGFIRAMKYFNSSCSETIIFEDSEAGLEAAKLSGAFYYKTYKFI